MPWVSSSKESGSSPAKLSSSWGPATRLTQYDRHRAIHFGQVRHSAPQARGNPQCRAVAAPADARR